MKIRVDENISWRVVAALKGFMSSRSGLDRSGLELSWVRDSAPPSTSDPTWIKQFASEGGTAIISGDHNILKNWPDLIAYTESGLISFFPPTPYEHMKGNGRAAFWMMWFPAIVEKAKSAPLGTRWRIQMQWNAATVERITAIEDPRLASDQKKQKLGIVPLSKRMQFRKS